MQTMGRLALKKLMTLVSSWYLTYPCYSGTRGMQSCSVTTTRTTRQMKMTIPIKNRTIKLITDNKADNDDEDEYPNDIHRSKRQNKG